MIAFDEMYDEFELQVATIFTAHKELEDNIMIERNNELRLKKGFCVEWTQADNTERMLTGRMSVRQTAVVTNTLAMDASDTDIEARKLAVKTILENCHTMVQWVEENPQLNDKAVLVKFINHNGPELIFGEDQKAYLMIQATYQLEWF